VSSVCGGIDLTFNFWGWREGFQKSGVEYSLKFCIDLTCSLCECFCLPGIKDIYLFSI